MAGNGSIAQVGEGLQRGILACSNQGAAELQTVVGVELEQLHGGEADIGQWGDTGADDSRRLLHPERRYRAASQ